MSHAPTTLGTAGRRALVASATMVYGCLLGAALGDFASGLVPPRASYAFYAVLIAPAVDPIVRELAERVGLRASRSRVARLVVQLLPFALVVDPTGSSFVRTLFVFLYGHLLLRSNARATALVAFAAGPLGVFFETWQHPSATWILCFAASVGLSTTGLCLAQSHHARQPYRERVARILPGRAVARAPREAGVLALHALAVAALVLLVAPLLFVPLALVPSFRPTSTRLADLVPGWDDAPEPSDAPRAAAPAQVDNPVVGTSFSDMLELVGRHTPALDEVVLRVTPYPRRYLGPLYLRGMVLDTIDTDGATYVGSGASRTLDDLDDGRADGWIHVAPPDAREVGFELDIVQQAFLTRIGASSLLFAPRPLVGAGGLPVVEFDPDGLLLTPAESGERLDWSARCARPRSPTANAARNAGERYLELPNAPESMRTLARLARSVTRGATNDRGRVARVRNWFRDEFEYALTASELPGLDGVMDFLDRRRGYCTYYATASTLMLRSLGIPARIATGFLADEWDAEAECYTVTLRHGHAWTEVEFESVGWIAFDATPSASSSPWDSGDSMDSGDAGSTTRADVKPEGVADWSARLWHDVDNWATTGETFFLRRAASALGAAPDAIATSVGRRPWVILLPIAALVVHLRRRARRSKPRVVRDRSAALARSEALFERLLDALSRIGYRRVPSQTLREFARRATAAGDPTVAPLDAWTERFYRARYGAAPLTQAEREDLERFIDALGRAAVVRTTGGVTAQSP